MNLFINAIVWMFSGRPASLGAPIPTALVQHLSYTAVSVLIAALIAIPIGWAIGHSGKGRDIAVAVAGAARAIPSFGLLVLLVLVIGVLHKPEAAITCYVLLGVPSILAGAYSGFESIDRSVVSAARALGMTEWQILWRVEVPLGLPLLVAGLRAATLQIVATVTIGAYVGLGGLGQYIIAGIPLRQFDTVLGGALLVAGLALLLDGLFALVQRLSVAEGVRPRKVAGRGLRGTPAVTSSNSPQAV